MNNSVEKIDKNPENNYKVGSVVISLGINQLDEAISRETISKGTPGTIESILPAIVTH